MLKTLQCLLTMCTIIRFFAKTCEPPTDSCCVSTLLPHCAPARLASFLFLRYTKFVSPSRAFVLSRVLLSQLLCSAQLSCPPRCWPPPFLFAAPPFPYLSVILLHHISNSHQKLPCLSVPLLTASLPQRIKAPRGQGLLSVSFLALPLQLNKDEQNE